MSLTISEFVIDPAAAGQLPDQATFHVLPFDRPVHVSLFEPATIFPVIVIDDGAAPLVEVFAP